MVKSNYQYMNPYAKICFYNYLNKLYSNIFKYVMRKRFPGSYNGYA